MNDRTKFILKLQETGQKTFSEKKLFEIFYCYRPYDKQQLCTTLDALVKDGYLYKDKRGQYSVSAPIETVRGVVRGNKRGFAFLQREDGKGEDIFIPSAQLNGACNLDTVVVTLHNGDATVTRIVKRGVTQLTGTFFRSSEFNASYSRKTGNRGGFVSADDSAYYTYISVPVVPAGVHVGDKVVVRIVSYERRKANGEILEVLGKTGEPKAETRAILRNHGFFEEFPPVVTEYAETLRKKTGYKGRTDFTALPTVTIDGDDAKDFDDAISVAKDENGYTLHVHIADVSHYVTDGGILDKEAFNRGTSVYFPGQVFPMLPEVLSNDLCSLTPNTDKLVLTCIMHFDLNGKRTSAEVSEAVINSNRRLTYAEVTALFLGDAKRKDYAEVLPLLTAARELATVLKERRRGRGSIDFETKECAVVLAADGTVQEIIPYPFTESNGLIQEFMLAANEAVAELLSNQGMPCVFRVHDAPTMERTADLSRFLSRLGLPSLPEAVSPSDIAAVLEEVRGTPAESIVNKVMLRSMAKARYDAVRSPHFALAAEYYCHFTSPIRRYPDLVVHRVFKKLAAKELDEVAAIEYNSKCALAAKQATARERAAELAERDATDYYKAQYMSRHLGERFCGIISGITATGVFVQLPNTVEGMVPISDFGEYAVVNTERYCLETEEVVYSLTDSIDVIVSSVSMEERKVRFTIDGAQDFNSGASYNGGTSKQEWEWDRKGSRAKKYGQQTQSEGKRGGKNGAKRKKYSH